MICKCCGKKLEMYEHVFCHNQICLTNRMKKNTF